MQPLDKVRRHVRILGDLGRLASEAGELQTFLDRAVTQVARGVEIHHVKVLKYRPATADLIVIAGTGWKPGVVGSAILPSDLRSPPGQTWQSGEPLVIKRLDAEPDFLFSEVLKQHEIVSLANVPVFVNGLAWGVLEVDSTNERDFSLDTTYFLVAAAALIGSLVQREVEKRVEVERETAAAIDARYSQILLRELQHRVKNNFQLILASVLLQQRRHRSQEVREALESVTRRISALSLAHDQLAPRDDTQVVKLADYLRALCHSIDQQVENVEIDFDGAELDLTVERAVCLGLILNEAVVNSIKHAFGEGGGQIRATLETGIGYAEGRLTVADNGRGMEKAAKAGSGLKLIDSLARQIGARIARQSSTRGTRISVTFPLIG